MSDGREPLPPESFREDLERALPAYGLTVAPRVLGGVARFLAELDRWRGRVNLTGRLSSGDLVAHAAESLLGAKLLPTGEVVDIGTGGGFPGVPLALARSDLQMTWLEPREKRGAFLSHVARTVPVPNATVVAGRLETLAPSSFDSATSRAVKIDGGFRRAAFLRPGGTLLLWTAALDRLAPVLVSAGLELESSIPIPGALHRAIAAFRKG